MKCVIQPNLDVLILRHIVTLISKNDKQVPCNGKFIDARDDSVRRLAIGRRTAERRVRTAERRVRSIEG